MNGEKVREELEFRRINYSQLARDMGVAPQNVTSLFNSPDVKSGSLEAIAKALGSDMSMWYPELAPKGNTNIANGNTASTITQSNNSDSTKMEMLIAENARLVEQCRQLTMIITNLTRPR